MLSKISAFKAAILMTLVNAVFFAIGFVYFTLNQNL